MNKKIIRCEKRKTGRFLLISSLLIVLCISAAGFAGCGKQEEHTHAFTEQNVKQTYLAEEATCTQAAKYNYSCTCGEKGTNTFEIGNALGHNFGEWVTVTPATEEKDGLEERTCARCEEKEQQEVPATGSLGLTYSVNEDGATCTVTGIGTCTDSEIIIPKKSPEGYTVTKIGNKSFADISATSITIPDTVTEIGSRAFYNCTGITEIHIPSSVTEIGTQIFYKASDLVTVYYDSTYSDQNNKFLGVANIKKVVFGGKFIPDNILSSCTNITEVEISENVRSIGDSAFWRCSGFTSITIPDSVTSIGDSAFRGCSGLRSVTIPDSVTSIGSSAFKYCSGLTSVTIGNSMTSIGSGTFLHCSSLTSITIPDSVTSIEYSAFGWCSGLTSIVIPDSVTSIGVGAFYECSGLTSVTIGNGVTSIGNYAFEDCSGLTEIRYNGTMAQWKAILKDYHWNIDTNEYIVYCTDGNLTKDEA